MSPNVAVPGPLYVHSPVLDSRSKSLAVSVTLLVQGIVSDTDISGVGVMQHEGSPAGKT